MDREYLEDYEQKEKAEYERLLIRIREGKFSFAKDKYPTDKRFRKLQKPVVLATRANYWTQIPFCGTLVLRLAPVDKSFFEEVYFKISEIPKVIDFINDTGRLQVVLSGMPLDYEGFDFMEPFFKQLSPPASWALPPSLFWSEKEIQSAEESFQALGKIRYFDYQRKQAQFVGSNAFSLAYKMDFVTYLHLKLGRYTIVEEIENLMVDKPLKAFMLLGVCEKLIVTPIIDLQCDTQNFRLDEIASIRSLPHVYQPKEMQFPCEIGKFLMKEKLTLAPLGLEACKELIYNYEAYDLQKIQKSLNEAILANHPDIVSKNADAFSEILDNVWNDSTIPKRVKNLRRGIPMSIAAIGSAVSAFTGGLEGFLAGLGFGVGAKFLDVEIEGLSERIVKFFSRSYQANVYDFKKKYKGEIVSN